MHCASGAIVKAGKLEPTPQSRVSAQLDARPHSADLARTDLGASLAGSSACHTHLWEMRRTADEHPKFQATFTRSGGGGNVPNLLMPFW